MTRPNSDGWEYELDIERKSGSPMIDYVYHKRYDSFGMASFAAGLFTGKMMLTADKKHRKFHTETFTPELESMLIQYELTLEASDDRGEEVFILSICENKAGSSFFYEIDNRKEFLSWV